MEIIQSIATKNPCYKAGKKIHIKGIMVSGVGSPQPSAKVFAHNWNQEKCEGRCAHAFVDANDGTVIQTLPWNHRGWHCGRHPGTKNSANYTHIGVKLCEPSQIRYNRKRGIELAGDKALAVAAVKRTYDSTVKLLANLCKRFQLDPMTAILSPMEGYKQRICAFHNELEALWEFLGMEYSMDGLRKDVKKRMDSKEKIAESQAKADQSPSVIDKVVEIKPEVGEIVGEVGEGIQISNLDSDRLPPVINKAAVVNPEVIEIAERIATMPIPEIPSIEPTPEPKMQIRIDIDNLRIRTSPGISNNVTGKYTGKGMFEILEIQNGSGSKTGWGKLDDGSGWVCLDYVTLL